MLDFPTFLKTDVYCLERSLSHSREQTARLPALLPTPLARSLFFNRELSLLEFHNGGGGGGGGGGRGGVLGKVLELREPAARRLKFLAFSLHLDGSSLLEFRGLKQRWRTLRNLSLNGMIREQLGN